MKLSYSLIKLKDILVQSIGVIWRNKDYEITSHRNVLLSLAFFILRTQFTAYSTVRNSVNYNPCMMRFENVESENVNR